MFNSEFIWPLEDDNGVYFVIMAFILSSWGWIWSSEWWRVHSSSNQVWLKDLCSGHSLQILSTWGSLYQGMIHLQSQWGNTLPLSVQHWVFVDPEGSRCFPLLTLHKKWWWYPSHFPETRVTTKIIRSFRWGPLDTGYLFCSYFRGNSTPIYMA